MIGFIFNHDVFDEPYNQTAVNKGYKKLDSYVREMGEHPFYTFGNRRVCFAGADLNDEYVIVQHSCDLNVLQKQAIAENVKEVLTVKKTVYKDERPEILVVFEKVEKEDCYCL